MKQTNLNRCRKKTGIHLISKIVFLSFLFISNGLSAQHFINPDLKIADGKPVNKKANGFKGIWYMNQPSHNEYAYKYSGGMAVYPANHRPFAVYSKKAGKTFFCFGGTNKENSTLLHSVSYFDHKTDKVANPTIVLDKGVTDAHDNPVISIDDNGYIWIFSTAHGAWRPSYISRSTQPYSIDSFELVNPTEMVNGKEVPFTNFSYFQVYHIKGKGFIALFTKYIKNRRVIGFSTSADGVKWNEWKQIANFGEGHYQVSDCSNGKIGVAFDYHPKGKGLNWRTNLQYLETSDFGQSWQTESGKTVPLPLTEIQNPALIHDFEKEKLNCYLSDIQLDKKGNPAILIITSKGYNPGPENGPRNWHLFTYGGNGWNDSQVTSSDNNYDMGSVYIESARSWKIIAPSADGPQAYNTGGEVVMWKSSDKGKSWTIEKHLTQNSPRNHCYVRRPLNAHPDFYGIWADGHGRKPSESYLYFCNKKGEVFVLPRELADSLCTPERKANIPFSDVRSKAGDLKHWPEGKSPEAIGKRVVEKFLNTPHPRYGNTHPTTPPSQITYPDVCTWLGGMWFAETTKNDQLFQRFEDRFAPLFDKDQHLQPHPNHVDNNVFGSIPLELYMRTGDKKYLDLGSRYADSQWTLPGNANEPQKKWTDQGYSWGRGNGWMAVGMAELLRILPKDNADRPVSWATCTDRLPCSGGQRL